MEQGLRGYRLEPNGARNILEGLDNHHNPRDFERLQAVIERVPERFPGVGPLNLISVRRLAA
jgi:hypothetical protein